MHNVQASSSVGVVGRVPGPVVVQMMGVSVGAGAAANIQLATTANGVPLRQTNQVLWLCD